MREKDMKNNIIKNAVLNALATAAYIVAVASFLFYVPKMFESETKTVLVPIAMLMLFVFSAAMTGVLILGRPALWYLDGKKKEALSLLGLTLVTLLLITLAAFFTLFVLKLGL